MKTYLFGLLLPLLPPLPLLFSLLLTKTRSPRFLRQKNEMLSLSHLLFSLNFPLINIWSPISLILPINLCYFYFGIQSSLLITFISHFFYQLQFYPRSSAKSRVHKFIILQFHLQNTTMALSAHIRPYSYMYCILSQDRALQRK